MSLIEVDENILNNIFREVRIVEGINLKTGEYDDKDMVKKIIQIIDSNIRKGAGDNEV